MAAGGSDLTFDDIFGRKPTVVSSDSEDESDASDDASSVGDAKKRQRDESPADLVEERRRKQRKIELRRQRSRELLRARQRRQEEPKRDEPAAEAASPASAAAGAGGSASLDGAYRPDAVADVVLLDSDEKLLMEAGKDVQSAKDALQRSVASRHAMQELLLLSSLDSIDVDDGKEGDDAHLGASPAASSALKAAEAIRMRSAERKKAREARARAGAALRMRSDVEDEEVKSSGDAEDENAIKLRLVRRDGSTILVRVRMSQPLVSIAKMKLAAGEQLIVDGEQLHEKDTASSLDLEDGDQLDIVGGKS
eukprot:PLAT6240.1.p1 GENE.PLAT6240.1~~PLAT6240.1.p1  ORF type:complete len:318 (+),score=103.44 PLAT6240.1:28-954(+)